MYLHYYAVYPGSAQYQNRILLIVPSSGTTDPLVPWNFLTTIMNYGMSSTWIVSLINKAENSAKRKPLPAILYMSCCIFVLPYSMPDLHKPLNILNHHHAPVKELPQSLGYYSINIQYRHSGTIRESQNRNRDQGFVQHHKRILTLICPLKGLIVFSQLI